MTMTRDFMKEIEAFCAETGMAASYMGQLAVKNSKIYKRLQAGGTVDLNTVEKIRRFMTERRKSHRRVA